jgi:hypothetical protein
MAYLTKTQVADIVKNAPQGTNPAGVVAALRKNGHELEGFGDTKPKISEPGRPSKLNTASKVFDFLFGGGKVGELIGTGIAKALAPTKESAATLRYPTASSVLGDIGGIGLTVAGAKGVGTVGSLGARALKTSALGAGFGAAGAIKGDKGAGDVLKSAAGGAVTGAALTGAGAALGAAGKFASGTLAQKVANKGLGVPSNKVSRGFGETLLEQRQGYKSFGGIQKSSNTLANQAKGKIATTLAASDKTVKNSEFMRSVLTDLKKNAPQSSLTEKAFKKRLSHFVPDHAKLLTKGELTLSEADALRSAIDKNLKEATHLGKELTGEKSAIKLFADKLRDTVSKGGGVESLRKTQSQNIGISKLAKKAEERSQIAQPAGLLDVAVGTGGFVGGGPGGAAVGLFLERVARNPRAQLIIAQLLRDSNKLEPLLRGLAPTERTLILRALSQAESRQ